MVRDYQTNPVTIEVGPEEANYGKYDSLFLADANSKKSTISNEIIRKCGRTILFCRTRAGADRVGDDLTHDGLFAQTLHGGLSKSNGIERWLDSNTENVWH